MLYETDEEGNNELHRIMPTCTAEISSGHDVRFVYYIVAALACAQITVWVLTESVFGRPRYHSPLTVIGLTAVKSNCICRTVQSPK